MEQSKRRARVSGNAYFRAPSESVRNSRLKDFFITEDKSGLEKSSRDATLRSNAESGGEFFRCLLLER